LWNLFREEALADILELPGAYAGSSDVMMLDRRRKKETVLSYVLRVTSVVALKPAWLGWKFKKKDKVIALHFNYLSHIYHFTTYILNVFGLAVLRLISNTICISAEPMPVNIAKRNAPKSHNDSIDQFWADLISNYCSALARPTNPPIRAPYVSRTWLHLDEQKHWKAAQSNQNTEKAKTKYMRNEKPFRIIIHG
jgi:hypothetical protein